MICEKVEYLSKFYNQETLLVHKERNEELFNKLYEETLPQQIRIEDVSDSDCAWFVDSEDGFVEVKSRIDKGEQEILLVTFSDNTVIRTSPFHLFESENGSWIATANLTPGTNIKTKSGIASVVSVTDTLKKECVYDLAVKHKSHKYYTDGISSHNSGAGKSVFLQNLAVNWADMGLNVVYISLELSEKLCAMRLDAMIADYGTNEVMKNIDDVAMRVGAFQKRKKGNICIKQMPNGCTANDVRAYIKEFEVQKGVTVDAILLDYLDLCMPMSVKVSPSDMFVKDKYVSEELRNLAVDLNILFVTASQLNRASHEEVEFDHSHISGGISKINTADNVIGIFVTPTMKENGRYQIQFMKTRSSSGVGSKVDLKFSVKSLRISDLEEGDQTSTEASTSSIINNLKNKSVMQPSPSEVRSHGPAVPDVISQSKELQALLRRK